MGRLQNDREGWGRDRSALAALFGGNMSGESTSQNGTPEEATARQELQETYARAGTAWKARDAAAIMQAVAPGFTQVMPDGQAFDSGEVEAALREWFATADAVTAYDVRIDALRLAGDEAVADVAETVRMTFVGPDGRQHERAQSNTARDTWVRMGKGWKVRRSEYRTGTMSIDGQPVE